MPRTSIPVQTCAAFGGKIQDIVYTAGDDVNKHQIAHPGGELLLWIKNADAAPHDVVLKSVASPRSLNRTADVTITTTNAKESVVCIPLVGYDQGGGVVHVDLADDTSMSFACFKLTPTE